MAHPQAAYIHVPFCRHRCGYCNFTLVAGRDDLIAAYLDALEGELSLLGKPQPVKTIFIGGGTPSHLPPAALQQLLKTVAKWHPLRDGGEWSIEANPSDVTTRRAEVMAAAGVNRISLGVQSFHPQKLKRLERDHTADTVHRAVEILRPHFASISLDLIFAAPEESLRDWQADLETALHLQPGHLSTYGLTYERGAAFWARLQRGDLQQASEDAEASMYEAAIERLSAAGYQHYEVSNFALPGHRCQHNETYWSGAGYFAAGPGAARFVQGVREVNHRSTTTWIKRVRSGQSPVAEREKLQPVEAARERLVFGLRKLEGVNVHWFQQQTGLDLWKCGGAAIQTAVHHGLLQHEEGQLKLTHAGLMVSDTIWSQVLSQDIEAG